MIEYWVSSTAVPIELFILSGGTTVTGRTPTVEIRNKDGGQHYDFAVRAFNAAPATTGLALTSAIDGLYRGSWDVSGLFTSNTFLTYEFHDATALSLEDVNFVRPPLVTGDVTVVAAGGGVVEIKGLFSDKQKDRLFELLEAIDEGVREFRQQALPMLRGLMSRKALEASDIEFLHKMKEKDAVMWRELIKILKLKEGALTQEVTDKLGEYIKQDEADKKELLALLDESITKKLDVNKFVKENCEDDDDDE